MDEMTHGCFWHLMEEKRLKAAIRCGIPEEYLLDGTVGCSGSSVVSWRIHRKPEDFPDALQNFVYNDCDLFVCQKHGSTAEEFLAFVKATFERLTAHGYIVGWAYCYEHDYMHDGAKALIYDFCLEGIETKLSLVQCQFASNIHEVVKGFDFDVVQAIYDFGSDRIIMDQAAEKNLKQGKMEVSPWQEKLADEIVSHEKDLSKVDIYRLAATLKRMTKYTERGFKVQHRGWFEETVAHYARYNLEYIRFT